MVREDVDQMILDWKSPLLQQEKITIDIYYLSFVEFLPNVTAAHIKKKHGCFDTCLI